MAKKVNIINVEATGTIYTVTYETGTVKQYAADKLPKTVTSWIAEHQEQEPEQEQESTYTVKRNGEVIDTITGPYTMEQVEEEYKDQDTTITCTETGETAETAGETERLQAIYERMTEQVAEDPTEEKKEMDITVIDTATENAAEVIAESFRNLPEVVRIADPEPFTVDFMGAFLLAFGAALTLAAAVVLGLAKMVNAAEIAAGCLPRIGAEIMKAVSAGCNLLMDVIETYAEGVALTINGIRKMATTVFTMVAGR